MARIEVSGLHFGDHHIDFVTGGARVKVGELPKGIRIETA